MCERFKQHILCFELNTVKNYTVLERGFSKQLDMKITYALQPSCFERKKKKKQREDGKINIGNYIVADVHTSWKKVKCSVGKGKVCIRA